MVCHKVMKSARYVLITNKHRRVFLLEDHEEEILLDPKREGTDY